MTTRRGMSLVEILIVVAVIGVLIGMLLPAIGTLRFRSRVLLTNQRMDQVLAALQGVGRENGSASYVLQRDLGLGGTAEFSLDATNQADVAGGAWHACYPAAAANAPGNAVVPVAAPGAPPVLAYPWGKARQYWIREPWYCDPLGLPARDPGDPAMTAAERDDWYARWRTPERHALAELWPRRTFALLRRAGVFEADGEAAALRRFNDRGRGQRWNDAWGNPLVVAYAIYQPTRCELGGRYLRDAYLKEALAQYQYNRSLYVAVGAAGPTLDPAVVPAGTLPTGGHDSVQAWEQPCADLWAHVCAGAMGDGQPVWDETSFDRPPWQGNRLGDREAKGKPRVRPLLSAPVEIK